MPDHKSLYILGAGFSCPASVPAQACLLKEVFDYTPGFTEVRFSTARDKVRHFIESLFAHPSQVTLEDLFTILDRSVIAKERFRDYTWSALYDYRQCLVYVILYIIEQKLAAIPTEVEDTYQAFAKILVDKRLAAGKRNDGLAVISSNWDTLLERFIYKEISVRNQNKMDIDYCIYTYFLNRKNNIPHTNLKARGWYNIKMLKLHGSLNWLYCTNCGRIYIDQTSIGIRDQECYYCQQPTSMSLYLEPLIITPTILKEYSNLHIKNIWQNAFIDIQEAMEIVFLGYSMPLADYEFKYLLKKAIKPGTKITAVLAPGDRSETKERYVSFLGDGVEFYFEGLEKWIQNS